MNHNELKRTRFNDYDVKDSIYFSGYLVKMIQKNVSPQGVIDGKKRIEVVLKQECRVYY